MKTWPAPAKLNLFLHVLGRRPDGYHRLQTVFQFLDLCDELSFAVDESGRVVRDYMLAGVPDDKDLCLRAARLLQRETGCTGGVRIDLVKRIPAGGGLGGGSSDAATTLLALNHLWGLGLDRPALAELGLRLGADVPVFVHGHAAWAEGVGERLSPLEPPERWYVVLCPPVHVSTASVFRDPQLTRPSPAITIRDFREGRTRNDLEAVVRARYPEVEAAIRDLSAFGPARMTGSGACVFLAVEDAAAGEAVLARRPGGCPGFVARGLNQHPLHRRLGEFA